MHLYAYHHLAQHHNKERGQVLMMSLKSISLTFAVAISAVLASTFVINPSPSLFLKQLIELGFTIEAHFYHQHHHNKHPSKDQIVNICDDFPPDIPPPDTNITSTLCVDRNGCCNFTTVQSAVDAVANFSQKRTIIWINSGIY